MQVFLTEKQSEYVDTESIVNVQVTDLDENFTETIQSVIPYAELFGNLHCIGEVVYLDQNAFEVVGIVIEQENEDTAKIYIPNEVVETSNMSCAQINQLWCQFGNAAEAALVIKKMGYDLEEMITCVVSLLLTVRITQVSWCVPPNYELIGKGWKAAFFTILKFYSLSGIELNNIHYLSEWNLLSLLLSMGSILSFGLLIAKRSRTA